MKTNDEVKHDPEFELMDTGIFNEDHYFDVFIEYAKNDPEDILIKITICNRCSEDASLNVLPTIWFRNTWAWGYDSYKPISSISAIRVALISVMKIMGDYFFYCEGKPECVVYG